MSKKIRPRKRRPRGSQINETRNFPQDLKFRVIEKKFKGISENQMRKQLEIDPWAFRRWKRFDIIPFKWAKLTHDQMRILIEKAAKELKG